MKTDTKKSQAAKAAPKNENALPAPKAESKPQAPEAVQALWKRAQAARAAAEVGLVSQEDATALWAKAEAASKPSPEALEKAEKAKAAKQAAEKKESIAKAAFEQGLIPESAFKVLQAEAEKARTAYKEAAQAAKGYGPGSGGRCKGLMSGVDAAIKVLSESKEAMQVGAICDKAMEQGLWNPDGQTPAATLSAAIQRELKKGEESRIVKVRQGYFTARKSAAAFQA